jgi:hypothetical protein
LNIWAENIKAVNIPILGISFSPSFFESFLDATATTGSEIAAARRQIFPLKKPSGMCMSSPNYGMVFKPWPVCGVFL